MIGGAPTPAIVGLTQAPGLRVDGLDSVRAFAALSVALAHVVGPGMPDLLSRLPVDIGGLADLSQYTFTGHPAVIVFFVVSGFCIHYPFTTRPVPVTAFWAARWVRIMIPALVSLLFATSLRIPGFNFVEGYILWSLVCELVYYTVYPLLSLLSRRVSWLVQFAIAFVVSYLLVGVLGSDQYGNAHIYGPYLNWLIGLPSWLAGCVLAEQVTQGRYVGDGHPIGLWRVAIVSTASSLYWLTLNTRVGYYLTLNAFSLLVVFWLGAEISSARRKGPSAVFEWIGKCSFSIYLFHIIAFTLIGEVLHPRWTGPQRLMVFPVVLVFCYLAYRMFEEPSHEYARTLFQKLRKSRLALSW